MASSPARPKESSSKTSPYTASLRDGANGGPTLRDVPWQRVQRESSKVQVLKRKNDEELATLNNVHVALLRRHTTTYHRLTAEISVLKVANKVFENTLDLIANEKQLLEVSLRDAAEQQDKDHALLVICNKRTKELEQQHGALERAAQESEEAIAASEHLCKFGGRAESWRNKYRTLIEKNRAMEERLELLAVQACCLCDKPATLEMDCCKALICGACFSGWKIEKQAANVSISCLYCRASPATTRTLCRPVLMGTSQTPIHLE